MKLHELKSKWISKLSTYEPRSEREKYIVDLLVVKLHNARKQTLPDVAFTAYLALKENISDELKELLRGLLSDISSIDSD